MYRLGVAPLAAEVAAGLPGDDIVLAPDAVMDRGFTLPAPPERVWPWFAQLGKNRAGWYLPRWFEIVVPPAKRGLRRIDPAWQNVRAGDVIPDWGGPNATFEIVEHEPPHLIVHRSVRGRLLISWVIRLYEIEPGATRVHLRFRISGVKRRRLVEYGGGLIDLLTVAGLAAGLRERVSR